MCSWVCYQILFQVSNIRLDDFKLMTVLYFARYLFVQRPLAIFALFICSDFSAPHEAARDIFSNIWVSDKFTIGNDMGKKWEQLGF